MGQRSSQLAEQSRGWSAREGDAGVARHARLLDKEKKSLSRLDAPGKNAAGDAGREPQAAATAREPCGGREADTHLMLYCLYENTHTRAC